MIKKMVDEIIIVNRHTHSRFIKSIELNLFYRSLTCMRTVQKSSYKMGESARNQCQIASNYNIYFYGMFVFV